MYGVAVCADGHKLRVSRIDELQKVEGGWCVPGRPDLLVRAGGWYKFYQAGASSDSPLLDSPGDVLVYAGESLEVVQAFVLGVDVGAGNARRLARESAARQFAGRN
jgi:hypothetical protein